MNIGIHFSNAYWAPPKEEAFQRLKQAKPDCIKTLLFSEPKFDQVAVHRRLREEHPDALIVARLYADMGGGPWPVADFVRRFQDAIESVRPYVGWFEVHNEPNLDASQAGYSEGFGASDADFDAFQVWIDLALTRLRQKHPWARWVFPGNAIHRYWEFWNALLPSIRAFDAWGVHCYWQFGNHTDLVFGRAYERAHQLLPGMPLIITEFGDSTLGRTPAQKIPIYEEWYREVDAQPYVLGTALYILGGTEDWISHPERPNFDVTPPMAAAIGALPRKARWPLVTDGFDFPVAKPDGAGYYIAAGLAEDEYYRIYGAWHTGEDWNDVRGGDSDLGAPVYAVAHGRVVTAQSFSGWGNIVLIEHVLPDGRPVWSQYAHLRERLVAREEIVRRGQQIGTIGKGDGDRYSAHLHFEIRKVELPASKWGWTAVDDREKVINAYAHPSEFIRMHRPGSQEVEVTVDDEGAGFQRSSSPYWAEDTVGYRSHTWWTWTVSAEQGEDCVATWTPELPRDGLYEVFAFIPRRSATTRNAQYKITHRRGSSVVAVSQAVYSDEWTSLGTYAFSVDQPASVRLSDLTGEPYTRDRALRRAVAFDAILWVLIQGE
jgi:murein DD-endopeptidase MepM/ murein hydrolase activator NlpD